MKTKHPIISASLAAVLAAGSLSAANISDFETTLIGQVAETASATNLSRSARAALIRSSVQDTLTAALRDSTDRKAIFDGAVALAIAGIRSAPEFSTEILAAVTSLPKIAAIQGLDEEIKAAVNEALANARGKGEPEVAQANRGARQITPIRSFSGSRAEAIVSPATVKPTPTPVAPAL